MKISARSSVFAGLVGMAIAGIWYSGAGCSSKSDDGTGGTTATGGTKSGTGGATTTGGSSGTGGATNTGGNQAGTGGGSATGGATTSTGGATAATGGTSGACTMGTAPASKDITNFDGASAGTTLPIIGAANGYLYTFSTGAPITVSLTGTTNMSLTFKETAVAAKGYDGIGISFPACYDVSAYTGVKFTLSAVAITGCDFSFGLDFAEDAPPTTSDPRGTCTTTPCYGPTTAITATTTMVPFTMLKTGGMPKDTNLKTVTGIKWQVHPTEVAPGDGGTTAAGCKDVAFTIDDVAFY